MERLSKDLDFNLSILSDKYFTLDNIFTYYAFNFYIILYSIRKNNSKKRPNFSTSFAN